MLCPLCKIGLKEAILCNIGVNYCPKCLGIWFEEEELRWAKDEKDKNLNWLDIDLWKDKSKFRISKNQKLCPVCNLPLYEVNYGDSEIKVDLCNLCQGIWLDRGEFKKIIEYLKEKANYEVLNNYLKNLLKEASEVFTGPESFREEVLDFLIILKLLNYKFATQHPVIARIISQLPK
ncbi:MAG: zf-TFIIB domain-containing protein [Patescibacteria group bacterium]|nr:zf-TFIIB domain-containing protein [Patescibacteria group bacterium]